MILQKKLNQDTQSRAFLGDAPEYLARDEILQAIGYSKDATRFNHWSSMNQFCKW